MGEEKISKRIFEDELQGTRELVVVPKKLKMKFMKLTKDQLGHMGAAKMIWIMKQDVRALGWTSWSRPIYQKILQSQYMRKRRMCVWLQWGRSLCLMGLFFSSML